MTNNRKDIKEKIAKVNKKDKEGMVKKVKKENEDITNLSEKKQYSIAKMTGEKIMNKKRKQKGRGLKSNILTLLQTISSITFNNETLGKKIDKSEDEKMKEYYSKLLENNKEYKAKFVRPNHIKTSFIYIDEESVSFKKYFVEIGVLTGFKTPMNKVFSSTAFKTIEKLKNEKDKDKDKFEKKIKELLNSFSEEWLGMSFENAIARAIEEDNNINYYILKLIKVKLYLDYYPNYKISSSSLKEMVEYFNNNLEIINSTVFQNILDNLSQKGEKLSEIIRKKNTRSIVGKETVYIASFNKIPFSKEDFDKLIKENKIEKEVSDGTFKKFFSNEGKEVETIQATTKLKFIDKFISELIKYLLDLYSVINYDDNKAKKEKMFSYEIIKELLEALKTEVDDKIREKIEAEIKQRAKKEGRVLQKIVGQLKRKTKKYPKLFYMFNIMKKEVLKNNKYKEWLKDLFSSTEFLSKIKKENFVKDIPLRKGQGQCNIDVSNNDRSLKLKFKVKKDDLQNNTNIKNVIYTTEFFYDIKSKGILDYYEKNEKEINKNIKKYIDDGLDKKNESESYGGIIILSNTLPEDFRKNVKKRIKEILLYNKTESKKEIFTKILKMLDEEIIKIEDSNKSDNVNDKFKHRIKNLIVVKITNTDIDEENGIIELIGLSSDIKEDTYIEEYSTISENIRSIYNKMGEGENITIQEFKKEVGYNEEDDIKNFIDVYMGILLNSKTDNDEIDKADIGGMGVVAFFLTMLNILLDDLKVLGRNTKASKLEKTKVNNSSKKQAVVKKQEKINNANKKAKKIFNKKN